MYDNEFKTKGKKIQPGIKLNHNIHDRTLINMNKCQ